jgi:hypothetical protein
MAGPRSRIWRSIILPHRVSHQELRALAYDLHAWRSTVWRLRDAVNCDADDLLLRIDTMIDWVTAEQARDLIDRVRCTADRA